MDDFDQFYRIDSSAAPAPVGPSPAAGAPLTLRERLRLDTRLWHEEVDRAYSGFDLRHPSSLAGFLRANLSALRSIDCHPGPQADAARLLRDEMATALEADLRHLGGPQPDAAVPVRFDATAVLYVLLGSRIGTQVLRRRWLGSTDAAVLGAGRYFAMPQRTGDWRDLCVRLAGASAHDPAAETIVRDACDLFGLYRAGVPGPFPPPTGLRRRPPDQA